MNFGFKGKGQERTWCKISTLTPFPLMIFGKRFQLEETVFLLVIKSYVKKEWTYTCHILRNFHDLECIFFLVGKHDTGGFLPFWPREAKIKKHVGHPGWIQWLNNLKKVNIIVKSDWNKGAPARVDRYLKKEYLCIVRVKAQCKNWEFGCRKRWCICRLC